MFRNLLRSLAPAGMLALYRRRMKALQRRELEKASESGDQISKEQLVKDLKQAGIKAGDTLLVHASLSKLGFVDGGAATVVDALLEVLGHGGNLLMPVSPNGGLQLEYLKQNPVYDVRNTSSALGAISEYFRTLPGVVHSAHPTEPVCAFGPNARYLTEGHFGRITPYDDHSPFFRITEFNGKILYLGVTFTNAGTSLHLLEDAVPDFHFPVYAFQEFDVTVIFEDGHQEMMRTKVHNPEQSAKRKCDNLIPIFAENGVLNHCKVGKAPSILVDSKAALVLMLKEYNKNGVTMYTPNGNK